MSEQVARGLEPAPVRKSIVVNTTPERAFDVFVNGMSRWWVKQFSINRGSPITPGDVVAMAIVAELVRDFGVRVGAVGDRFDQLLKECGGRSWLLLENCVALIEADNFRLVDANLTNR